MRGISSHHDFHNHRLWLGKSEIATLQASPILFLSWRCCSNRAGTRATQKPTNTVHPALQPLHQLGKGFHSKPCPPEWWILAMASPPLLEPETLMANDHRWLQVQPNGSTSFNIKFPKSSCKTHLWRYFWDLWVSFKRQLLLGTPACLEHCSLNLGKSFHWQTWFNAWSFKQSQPDSNSRIFPRAEQIWECCLHCKGRALPGKICCPLNIATATAASVSSSRTKPSMSKAQSDTLWWCSFGTILCIVMYCVCIWYYIENTTRYLTLIVCVKNWDFQECESPCETAQRQ